MTEEQGNRIGYLLECKSRLCTLVLCVQLLAHVPAYSLTALGLNWITFYVDVRKHLSYQACWIMNFAFNLIIAKLFAPKYWLMEESSWLIFVFAALFAHTFTTDFKKMDARIAEYEKERAETWEQLRQHAREQAEQEVRFSNLKLSKINYKTTKHHRNVSDSV